MVGSQQIGYDAGCLAPSPNFRRFSELKTVSMSYCASRCTHAPAKLAFVACLALGAIGWAASAWAGGGPEGLLLVVNPLSPSSLTIANHYAHWRAIPPDNVFYLPWDPNLQTADIDTFRQRILFPLLVAMQNRNLLGHIDYIVYSSDFPWGIGLDSVRVK